MGSFRINLQWDDKALKDQVDELSQRSLAYATVNAINNVAKVIQKAEREKLDDTFTIRTPQTKAFLERQIALIKPFASVGQDRAFAEISVGKRPRLVLSVFEGGGEKDPASRGAKRVGVPITGGPARLSFSSPVAETLYLRKLKFKAKKTASGAIQYKGQKRTFLLKRTEKSLYGGVFQRVGPHREDIRLVYSFKQRPKLRAVLKFIATADDVGKRWLKREFEDQVKREIDRAARKRG